MASTTFTVISPAITGTTITAKTSVASSETMTISPSTALSTLDSQGLYIRATNTNTTESVTLSIGVGTQFSARGIGAATVTIATNASVLIGGKLFDTARFQTSGGTIVITQTGTGPTSWEAYQAPRADA